MLAATARASRPAYQAAGLSMGMLSSGLPVAGAGGTADMPTRSANIEAFSARAKAWLRSR